MSAYIKEKSAEGNLCREKKEKLKKLNHEINSIEGGVNLFYIEPLSDPETNKGMGRYYRKYKKAFIEPYGYVPLSNSSESNKQIGESYRWVVSDILLSGKAKVYNKEANSFEENIVYQVVDFKDGQGGENILFEDNRLFFNVKVYSDVAWPDFDCMDSTELINYGKR